MRFLISLCVLSVVLVAPLGAHGIGVREKRPNLIFGELGGRALASINYERYLSDRTGFGVGGMYFGSAGGVIPVSVSMIPTGDIHSLYLSAGVTFGWDSSEAFVWPTAGIGYQFQSQRGFFLRLSVSNVGFWPVLGVAVGGSF